MLNNPKLALCDNRKVLPKKNEKSGSPEEWFENQLLSEHGMIGANLDFFVNWQTTPPSLSRVLWIKQILSEGVTYDVFHEATQTNLVNRFGLNYLNLLCKFSQEYELPVYFVLLNDSQDWNNPDSKVSLIEMKAHLEFDSKLLPIAEFKTLIQQHSGGKVHVGSKGLKYGTSRLECLLSHTDSAYPGDLDLLLMNDQAEPVAILEFKKHTLSPDIDSQTLTNYYPYPDGRKYDRLAIFREYIQTKTGRDIPIIIVYYPSDPLGMKGKMEVLTGGAGKLTKKRDATFNLPPERSKANFEKIITYIPRAIAAYYSPTS